MALEYRLSGTSEKITLTVCPVCGHSLPPNTPHRTNHLTDDHEPEDFGLSEPGSVRTARRSDSSSTSRRVAADGGTRTPAVPSGIETRPILEDADLDLDETDYDALPAFASASFRGAFLAGVRARHYAAGLQANPYQDPRTVDQRSWADVYWRHWRDGWHWEDAREDSDWGLAFERRVCLTRPCRHAGGDTGEHWYDAELEEPLTFSIGPRCAATTLVDLEPGDRLECKVAAARVEDDGSRRRGRYWVQRSNHDRLVDAGGAYCFGVYDEPRGIHRVAYATAEAVDDLLTWTSSGPGHPIGEHGKLPWTGIFADVDDAGPPVEEVVA